MYFREKEYFCGLKVVCVSVRARVVRIYTRPMKNIYQRKKHYNNNMKRNIVLLTVFLSMTTLAVYAQPFTPTQTPQVAMQSQQIMQNGQNHDGTIYAPFDNTMPSEQSSGPNKKGGVRKSDGDDWNPGWGDETPGPDINAGQESPVGEPWVLAAFALLFAGVVYLRGKKKAIGRKE